MDTCLGTADATIPVACVRRLRASFSSRCGHGARPQNSCVHTNRMNWTVRSSVLGAVPWPPSVETTLLWSIWIFLHLIWFGNWENEMLPDKIVNHIPFIKDYTCIQHCYVPPPPTHLYFRKGLKVTTSFRQRIYKAFFILSLNVMIQTCQRLSMVAAAL